MIFTTKNKELAIFGKTLSETKEKLIAFFEAFERGGINGQDGIIDTFFSKNKKSPLTPELFDEFERFKKKFNSSSLNAEALSEQLENVDQRIIDYAKTYKNGEMTTEGFKASIDTMSFSAKAGKVALQALAMMRFTYRKRVTNIYCLITFFVYINDTLIFYKGCDFTYDCIVYCC